MSLGKDGEGIAKRHFESLGYELVAENFRHQRAETDLIFKNDLKKLLVFVEVKTRRSRTFGEPEESVTERKMEQIIKSAQGFLMAHEEFEEYEKRFDIAAIMIEAGKVKMNHIKNAF
jgi:putative endonuclease